jgi:cation:H+ antiporter
LVLWVWVKFVVCLAIILFAGTKLARYGDVIAERTGLGRLWIGLVLLAFITSIPELTTGISAVALVKVPDLAMGTLMGSCIFNLLILAVVDVVHRRTPVLSDARMGHIRSSVAGILLIGFTAITIFVGVKFSGLSLGWLGVPSIIIIVVYLVAVRLMFVSERKRRSVSPSDEPWQYGDLSMRTVWFKFGLAAAAVIGAGIWLAYIGDEIDQVTGLGASFVGSLFLAFTTSVPELALSVAAVRLGAVDLAVADVLGANMINIAKIFILDLFYTEGSLIAAVSNSHIMTAIVAVVMTIIVIFALLFRRRRKTFVFISWYGVLLIALYVFGAYALFSGMSLG